MKNKEAFFIGTTDEPTTVQKYAMKTSDGFS
jgi:hypothetical protein